MASDVNIAKFRKTLVSLKVAGLFRVSFCERPSPDLTVLLVISGCCLFLLAHGVHDPTGSKESFCFQTNEVS